MIVAVAIVFVAMMLIVVTLVSRITVVVMIAIGRDDAAGGYEKKSGNGAVSSKAL